MCVVWYCICACVLRTASCALRLALRPARCVLRAVRTQRYDDGCIHGCESVYDAVYEVIGEGRGERGEEKERGGTCCVAV